MRPAVPLSSSSATGAVCAMSGDYVVLCGRSAIYAWHFANPRRRQYAELHNIRRGGFERLQHADDEDGSGAQSTKGSNDSELDFSKAEKVLRHLIYVSSDVLKFFLFNF